MGPPRLVLAVTIPAGELVSTPVQIGGYFLVGTTATINPDAEAVFTFARNPIESELLQITDGYTFTFLAAPSGDPLDQQVEIGADIAATIANLVALIAALDALEPLPFTLVAGPGADQVTVTQTGVVSSSGLDANSQLSPLGSGYIAGTVAAVAGTAALTTALAVIDTVNGDGGVTALHVGSTGGDYPDSSTPTLVTINVLLAITAVNQGTKTFTLTDLSGLGDFIGLFGGGDVRTIAGSTGNDGNYTVVSSTYLGLGVAEVVVVEAIPSAIADGDFDFDTSGDNNCQPFATAVGGNVTTLELITTAFGTWDVSSLGGLTHLALQVSFDGGSSWMELEDSTGDPIQPLIEVLAYQAATVRVRNATHGLTLVRFQSQDPAPVDFTRTFSIVLCQTRGVPCGDDGGGGGG